MGMALARSLVIACLVVAGAIVAPAASPVEPVQVTTELRDYPTFKADGADAQGARWMLVSGTGNCCESYVTTDAAGRIYDAGGSTPVFSEDGGLTWSAPRHDLPAVNGEGAVVVAPGGDVLAVIWDPYSGDRMVGYRREATTGNWASAESPVHTPFYDRPWLAVVPGPVTFAGTTYPWASIVQSNFTQSPLFISFDGLRYVAPTDGMLASIRVDPAPDLGPANRDADIIQPNWSAPLSPLPNGGALGRGEYEPYGRCPMTRLSATLEWTCTSWASEDAPSDTPFRVDSDGRIHTVARISENSFVYSLSPDGGATWMSRGVRWPDASILADESFDVKVHGATDTAVIVTHSSPTFAFRFSLTDGTPRLARVYRIGDESVHIGNLVDSSGPRLDFPTVALLPDGRIITSFLDAEHRSHPILAIEQP